jgi:hypothetical protein
MSSTIDVLRGIAHTKDHRKELLEAFHSSVNLCLATFGAEQREEEQLMAHDPCVLQLIQSIESLLVSPSNTFTQYFHLILPFNTSIQYFHPILSTYT